MKNAETIDLLQYKMMQFNQHDPKRIQHFMKVHRYAQMIGHMEHLENYTQFITECAAIVHDIGIRPAEEKYGDSNGKLQEKEGPAYAPKILEELSFPQADIDRICYLVGHHHTYTKIDGIDYQILIEADFLVNFYEDKMSFDTIKSVYNKIFQTEAGKNLCKISYF
ncbi:HD domain-containing protein [Thomasclavelia sp.]